MDIHIVNHQFVESLFCMASHVKDHEFAESLSYTNIRILHQQAGTYQWLLEARISIIFSLFSVLYHRVIQKQNDIHHVILLC